MKKKLAYVAFGHIDVTIPLIKYLDSPEYRVEFIFVLNMKKPKESIFDFSGVRLKPGFMPDRDMQTNVPAFIKSYLGNCMSKTKIFFYPSYKLLNIYTHLTSIGLFSYLCKFDILHFSGTLPLTLNSLFFLKDKKPKTIITVHDYLHHSGERKLINEKMNHFFLKRHDYAILQNKEDYISLKEKNHHQNKITYIPIAGLDYYKMNKEIDLKFDFLFFGRISEYKGLDVLLNVCKEFQSESKAFSLCIAGSGYSDTISEFSKIENVTILDRYIPSDEMIDLISSSRVVVCPYKDATQSGVAITALSFNKPVVASKVGGFTDLIINGINGFLVEPDDVLELKQAMELFLKDPFLCHTLSSQIQSSLKKNGFDWNQIVKKIFWVYDEITP